MSFFSELTDRWTKDSPKFFTKLQKFGAWLTGTGIGLIGVPAAMNAIVNTDMDLSLLGTIASYMILAGLIITVIAKLPTKDPQ